MKPPYRKIKTTNGLIYKVTIENVEVTIYKHRSHVFKNGYSNWDGKKWISSWKAITGHGTDKAQTIGVGITRKEAFEDAVCCLKDRKNNAESIPNATPELNGKYVPFCD